LAALLRDGLSVGRRALLGFHPLLEGAFRVANRAA
jgi:hypothetical protein